MTSAKKQRKNWLQKVVFAVGLVTTVGLVAILGWDAATTKPDPPDCRVTLGEVVRERDVYRMTVRVENRDGSSAENVRVDVDLIREGVPFETGSIELDFLPRGSTRTGSVTFTNDPQSVERVRARCAGYQIP